MGDFTMVSNVQVVKSVTSDLKLRRSRRCHDCCFGRRTTLVPLPCARFEARPNVGWTVTFPSEGQLALLSFFPS